jgi:heme/copper-type cytochrome/quinol oxidase subunit 3
MMWIFLLSDTFIFSCFLSCRPRAVDPVPGRTRARFALHMFSQDIP